VLRIRDVYPGSEIIPSRIPDKNFFRPASRIQIFSIPDTDSASKNLSILTQNNGFKRTSRIRILIFYPSRIPDPGVKKAPDPGSGSTVLDFSSYFLFTNQFSLFLDTGI
jgi:hypothetical protein